MKLEDVLNDMEKEKLARLADDPLAQSALRKVFLFGIYYNGTMEAGIDPDPTMNFTFGLMAQSRALDDEHIGRIFRAQMEGISSVEAGFKKLNEFKISKESITPDKKNQAR